MSAVDYSAWRETPPAQPRWWRLNRFDSVWGNETDISPLRNADWRGSEWRLELSLRRQRVRDLSPRRIICFTRNRRPLTERALHYHGMRFSWRMTWNTPNDS